MIPVLSVLVLLGAPCFVAFGRWHCESEKLSLVGSQIETFRKNGALGFGFFSGLGCSALGVGQLGVEKIATAGVSGRGQSEGWLGTPGSLIFSTRGMEATFPTGSHPIIPRLRFHTFRFAGNTARTSIRGGSQGNLV
jgi:hypothetical protein